MLYIETVYIYMYLWFIIQEPTKQIYEYFLKKSNSFSIFKSGHDSYLRRMFYENFVSVVFWYEERREFFIEWFLM